MPYLINELIDDVPHPDIGQTQHHGLFAREQLRKQVLQFVSFFQVDSFYLSECRIT